MNTPNDTFPQTCTEVGLVCESCIAGTARDLASVCKGLTGKMIGQLFVQIHPSPACAPMHARFAMRYREAAQALAPTVAAPLPEPIPMRREVMFARPRTIAAVA